MGAVRAIGGVFLSIGIVLAMVGVAAMAASYGDESDNQAGEEGLLFDRGPDEERSERNAGLFVGGASTLGLGFLIMVVGGVLLAFGGSRQQQQQTVVVHDPAVRR